MWRWRSAERSWRRVFAVLVIAVVLLALALWGYGFGWTGFGESEREVVENGDLRRAKTLWDWMELAIVPVVIAVGGYLLGEGASRRAKEAEERSAEEDALRAEIRGREDALREYVDRIGGAISEHGASGAAGIPAGVRTLMRAQTLSVLRSFGFERNKASEDRGVSNPVALRPDLRKEVLRFLDQAELIKAPNPAIELRGADLRLADMASIELAGASLRGADLTQADLSKANLREAYLSDAILRKAVIQGADMTKAKTDGADMEDVVGTPVGMTPAKLAEDEPLGGVGRVGVEPDHYVLARALQPLLEDIRLFFAHASRGGDGLPYLLAAIPAPAEDIHIELLAIVGVPAGHRALLPPRIIRSYFISRRTPRASNNP